MPAGHPRLDPLSAFEGVVVGDVPGEHAPGISRDFGQHVAAAAQQGHLQLAGARLALGRRAGDIGYDDLEYPVAALGHLVRGCVLGMDRAIDDQVKVGMVRLQGEMNRGITARGHPDAEFGTLAGNLPDLHGNACQVRQFRRSKSMAFRFECRQRQLGEEPGQLGGESLG